MSSLKNLQEVTVVLTGITSETISEPVRLDGLTFLSSQFTASTPIYGTPSFASAFTAKITDQGILWQSVFAGSEWNALTLQLINSVATDCPLSISVVGSAIAVTLHKVANAIVTTATQLVSAVNADVSASALIIGTGSGASPLVALALTPFTGGTDGDIDSVTSTVTLTAHGLPTGLKVQLTTDGSLPSPLAVATDYYLIALDQFNMRFASSLENALAGTFIVFGNAGTFDSTDTIIPDALADGMVAIERSNDGVNWQTTQTHSITMDESFFLYKQDPETKYIRAKFTVSTGGYNVSLTAIGKGIDS